MLSFFPRDVLDEIWDVIESVSKGFSTYSSIAHSLSLSNFQRPDMAECSQPALFIWVILVLIIFELTPLLKLKK